LRVKGTQWKGRLRARDERAKTSLSGGDHRPQPNVEYMPNDGGRMGLFARIATFSARQNTMLVDDLARMYGFDD
jgi:hypothetical protein